MATLPPAQTFVSVREYLKTSYHPDREYVDGQIVERNLGEKDHSLRTKYSTVLFAPQEEEWGIQARTKLLKTERRISSIIEAMATLYISETEATRDFAGLLNRVRAGDEAVIESDAHAVALLHSPNPPRRSIEECIALLPVDSSSTIDEDFASDVAAAVAKHRQPLNPAAWK